MGIKAVITAERFQSGNGPFRGYRDGDVITYQRPLLFKCYYVLSIYLLENLVLLYKYI